MSRRTGTYVVANADEGAAELRDADSGQVLALSDNPGLAAGEAIEATVEPAGDLGVAYEVVDVERQWTVDVSRSREPPTRQEEEAAADSEVGELTRIERAGEGELHVIAVPEGESEAAVEDVLADEAGLRARAARLGVNRVSVRSADEVAAAAVGVVSVRYMP